MNDLKIINKLKLNKMQEANSQKPFIPAPAVIAFRKVKIEKELLTIKINKLKKFIDSDFFKNQDKTMQDWRKKQLTAMGDYQGSLMSVMSCFMAEHGDAIEKEVVLTKGEEIIGSFNPNNLSEVDEIKLEAITLINTIDAAGKDPRRKAKSFTDIEQGAMFAVKSLFQ